MLSFDIIFGTKVEQKIFRLSHGQDPDQKRKEKTSFTVAVRVKGYKSVSRTFNSKGEARTWASEVEAEMKNTASKIPDRQV